mmetsp:Transcript_13035/g.18992  ORF Transcript_13035/g.18992 Transcript_13035/m.18992 type:complete len:216 (-) Transcript_13035:808-1455(-)|eukprot:CAMPEP_0197232498 /NCGR_PEP_ID=MMETSP1429-20130617/746_1 /TAXON_ID=49237 /ORGANISM="Chaetoceros  sp., Strain UNC1202" /LENGTH=215 /DNA_ID=CAMNT_0042690529 /DNA_START=79 /DNA_END=729 /DNA_ORIENTATION=+
MFTRSLASHVVISCLLVVGARGFSLSSGCIREQISALTSTTLSAKNSVEESRRSVLQALSFGSVLLSFRVDDAIAAAPSVKLATVLPKIEEARAQLLPVPGLIKLEKWDSVRAILITPPLSDCWSKTSKLLQSYAVAIGEEMPDGDEFAALELKEEALDHLRFLDMAAYNNVFNPIKTEGENGATKELVRSYYDDPVREYEACARVFNGLVNLAK